MQQGSSWFRWAVVSVMMPVAVPLLLIGALFIAHLASFHGICGPYAPDIDAYPCDLATYAHGFVGGFAMIGLVILTVGAASGTALAVATIWIGALVVRQLTSAAARQTRTW